MGKFQRTMVTGASTAELQVLFSNDSIAPARGHPGSVGEAASSHISSALSRLIHAWTGSSTSGSSGDASHAVSSGPFPTDLQSATLSSSLSRENSGQEPPHNEQVHVRTSDSSSPKGSAAGAVSRAGARSGSAPGSPSAAMASSGGAVVSAGSLSQWPRVPPAYIALFSALLYGSVGLAMGFVNKAVLQMWPYSNSLLMFQMAASVAIVWLATVVGLVETRPITLRAASNLWGVVFFYNANVAFALAAVQALSIPVYHVLKRLTPVMVLATKMLVLGEPAPPLSITAAVVTVVAGCVLSGAGDLSFDLNGYVWAIVSCVLQSTYLILVERTGGEKGYTSSELMVYNAIMSLPVLMALTLSTGEAFRSIPVLVHRMLHTDDGGTFTCVFVVSLVLGVLLNYSLFLCTLANTALTTTIVGALRSVLGTVLGFFLLGGVKATPLIVVGAATNTLGGIWYTVAKYRHKSKSSSGNSSKGPPSSSGSKSATIGKWESGKNSESLTGRVSDRDAETGVSWPLLAGVQTSGSRTWGKESSQ